MLAMLSTVVVVGSTLILTLLCAVLVLPTPDDPARPLIDHRPRGETPFGEEWWPM